MKNEKLYPDGFAPLHLLSGMKKDSSVLVGFSGGADSRVLLDLLYKYSQKTGAKVYAAHVNHGIRGEEALRDERFCVSVAEKYGIPIFVHHIDIPSLSAETGKSIELCARDERYAFFARVMKEHGIPLLATAHNANDNLETMIFNLTRGTGLSGLCGIPRARKCDGGLLVRPILEMSRDDVLEYCNKNSLDFVTDSTNLDTAYTRNKIRSNVIPVLKQLNPSAEGSAFSTAELLRRDAEFLDSLADGFIARHKNSDGSLPLNAINCESDVITSRAIIKLYSELCDTALEAVHVSAILTLCKKSVAHSSICLPCGVFAAIENSSLIFTKNAPRPTGIPIFEIEAHEGSNSISQINAEIIIGNTHKEINIYKKSIQFDIDSAKISGKLILRSRKEGDTILVGGMHKSVKKLLCEKKIPLDERCRLTFICDDDGIVAIPFIGVRDGARIINSGNSSESALTIQFYLY